MARIIGYVIVAYLVYMFCDYCGKKEALFGEDDRKIFVIVALIWPLTLAPMLLYMFASHGTPVHDDGEWPLGPPAQPMAPWKPTKHKGDYNTMIFGEAKEEGGDDDMAAFIEHLSRRPDAPLPNEMTISYKVTGISKTYPAGTPFPSTLIKDWRSGFFMGKQAAEHGDS